ncbi:hypothetical protein Btru_024576 [Bulinus truncatus]|nr:hypothetical protein Btru_024576 [Bulinus truncatus]
MNDENQDFYFKGNELLKTSQLLYIAQMKINEKLTNAYFKRLASYSSLPENKTAVFRTELALHGFSYTGRGDHIECEGCKITVQIFNDLLGVNNTFMHKAGCLFENMSKTLVNHDVVGHMKRSEEDQSFRANDFHTFNVDVESDSMSNNLESFSSSASMLALTAKDSKQHQIDPEDFSAFFQPEYFAQNSPSNLVNVNFSGQDCQKNPGHFGNISLNLLTLEQIPSVFRCNEMLTLLKLMGDLTVRVIVPHNGSYKSANEPKVKLGTGFVMDLAWEEIERKEKSLKIFIQTSRHLIYNNEEAHHVTVEFFCDNKEHKDIVTFKGKGLLISKTPGDSQCVLICESSDAGFIQKINQIHTAFRSTADQLPVKVKKRICKKLFITHHPHGGCKVLSYGDYVTVKYRLDCSNGEDSCATLIRMAAKEQAPSDMSHYRKALLYTADTCPGSCGAPVLTFIDRSPSSFSLDIWMHNGLETEYKLGVSSLKVCAKEDFLQSRSNEDSEDDITVGENYSQPSHLKYVLYQTRLDSFNIGAFNNVLQPQKLASSGFFSTGMADCVRCFQCGLGLRSWKEGDDPTVQHQKYAPDCPYLKTLNRKDVKPIIGATAEFCNQSSCENIPLKLVEADNKTLKNQLICKVCKKSDVKDMFLPCGELFACSECSKSLTVCPSCQKPILATVTVYLT